MFVQLLHFMLQNVYRCILIPVRVHKSNSSELLKLWNLRPKLYLLIFACFMLLVFGSKNIYYMLKI